MVDFYDFVQLFVTLYVLAFIGSLVQLFWTRRIARRVESWLASPSVSVDGGSFAKFSGAALIGWLVLAFCGALLIGGTITLPVVHMDDGSAICLTVVSMLWSLLMVVVSLLSLRACAASEQFAVLREFGDDHEIRREVAQLLPGEVTSIKETGESVRRRWGTIGAIASTCLIAVWVVGGFALLVAMLAAAGTGLGSIGLLGLIILVPGFFALMFARWAVFAKSQRAQFLWFLALTVEKQRALAPELRQWAMAHPDRFGAQVLEAARDLAAGDALSESLAGRNLVSPSDLLSIRVGEPTGRLAQVLRESAVRQTSSLKRDAMETAASGPVLYFGALILVAMNITMFLMYYIVPKFKMIFMGFGTELPGITVALITVSDMFVDYFYLFAWIPMLALLAIWTCGEAFFTGWSETWLAWFVGVGRQAEVPRLLRRLREAVAAKVPWDQALRPMLLHHHRDSIRLRLERVFGRVTAGMNLWPAMHDSGLLTRRDVSLLEMAERANNLTWTLAALAEAKERSLAHRWRMIVTLLTPVGIICGGMCVFFICVGFFMPLVKLLNDLSCSDF